MSEPSDEDYRLRQLLEGSRHGVLATLKQNGLPQLSNVGYAFLDGRIMISTTHDRAKTRNLRRDSRAVFHVSKPDFYGYAVAECAAELSDVTTEPTDATADELVRVYRAIAGEHPDWDEFRAAMVAEGRLVCRLRINRVYGFMPPAA